MKKTILLFLIAFSTQLFGQIPCDFSWENAPTITGNRNFITSSERQPYQGPCLAFAFCAAIESQYAIENNIHKPKLNLSEAYLDYKVYDRNNFKSVLENGFKIPTGAGMVINSFPPFCSNENNCYFKPKVKVCINDTQGQKNYSFNLTDVGASLLVDPKNPVTCKGFVGNSMTVNNVTRISSINSNDDLKLKILKNGPVILRVDGLTNARKFRNYNAPANSLTYHAFTIIGWTNDSRWIIKDSWPNMPAGIITTHANVNIVNLMNKNVVELYQVSGVSYNGSPTSQNPAVLSITNCSVKPVLSPIRVEIDYAHIGGYMYHKFWVTSNISVDTWVWSANYPYGYMRSQVNNANYSSVLFRPTTSSKVTVFVNGFKNNKKVTKKRVIYLYNGQSSRGRGWRTAK